MYIQEEKFGLLRVLCTRLLSGCHNVEEYVSKRTTTAHKQRYIGFKVDDDWLDTPLLSGVPQFYKPMIKVNESSSMKLSADSVEVKIPQVTGH